MRSGTVTIVQYKIILFVKKSVTQIKLCCWMFPGDTDLLCVGWWWTSWIVLYCNATLLYKYYTTIDEAGMVL